MTSSDAIHAQDVLERVKMRSQMVLDQSPDPKQWLTHQSTLDDIAARSRCSIELFEAYIHKCLRDLSALGLIPPPDRQL